MTTEEAKCLTSPTCLYTSISWGRAGVAHWALLLSPAVSRGCFAAVQGLLTVVASCLQSSASRHRLHGWGTTFSCPVERGGSSQTTGWQILNHSPGKSPYQHIRSQLYSLSYLQYCLSIVFIHNTCFSQKTLCDINNIWDSTCFAAGP